MNQLRWYVLPALCILMVTPVAAQDAWLSRLSARHTQGNGVGYQDGYTSVDWFLPLLANEPDSIWFGDFRAILSTDAEFSSNLGTGYRWYEPEQNRIYGANIYWDTRQLDDFTFSQLGIGLQSFGEIIDLELNGYTPAVNDTHQQSVQFSGNNLLVHSANALSGMDFMAGYNVPPILDFHTRVLGGVYFYDSNQTPRTTGWRVRLETALQDWLAFTATAQDDELFGRTVVVSAELRRTIEHESNAVTDSMRHKFRNAAGGGDDDTIRHRLADPVRRQQQIVLTQNTQLATGPGNVPLTFLHVVPGAAGTGTFENPYGTITNAMGDGLAPTSVVYTPQGGAFIEDVALVAGTQLRSNGPRQIVQSMQGPLTLPFSGVSSDLNALPASITGNIDLANNTTLNGFDVTGTVAGNGVTNAVVDTNRIRQPLAMDAVTLTDSMGITLNNLLIDQSGFRGVGVDNSSATISNITLSTIADDAIEINNGAGTNTVDITTATISDTMGEGIDTNLNGAGDLTVSVQQTSIASTGNAFSAVEDAASTGDLIVDVVNTSAGATAGSGFAIDGSMGAGTTFVSQFQSNSVTASTTGGATFTDVAFDAAPGGALDPVTMTSLAVGSTTARVTGTGVSFVNATGDVDMGNVDIFNNAGAGLFVNTSPALTLRSQAGSTIDTTAGPALDLTATTTALIFDTVSSVNSPDRAASFDTVDGSLAVTTTTANDAVNPPFIYTNIPNPFAVSFGNTTINSLQGPLITDNETRVGGVAGLPAAAAIYNPLQIIFP
jgi:hypothetical protein